MIIFKPDIINIDEKQGDIRDKANDEFYKHSHGILESWGEVEFTICGIACEEWDYVKMLPRTKITCPKCLATIRECKSYKL